MTDTDDLVKRLEAIYEHDWRTGHLAYTSDTAKDAATCIRALAAQIVASKVYIANLIDKNYALTAQLAALREEAKKVLGYFLRDERFQVGVGGNPNVVENMIDEAAAFLAKLEAMKP